MERANSSITGAPLGWCTIPPRGGAESCPAGEPLLECWKLPRGGGRVMARGSETDRLIQRLGDGNNRVVTRRFLEAAGVGTNAITNRVVSGRLFRQHHGVYLLDRPQHASRVPLLTAAVAACGATAVLRHQATADLWAVLRARAGHADVAA